MPKVLLLLMLMLMLVLMLQMPNPSNEHEVTRRLSQSAEAVRPRNPAAATTWNSKAVAEGMDGATLGQYQGQRGQHYHWRRHWAAARWCD